MRHKNIQCYIHGTMNIFVTVLITLQSTELHIREWKIDYLTKRVCNFHQQLGYQCHFVNATSAAVNSKNVWCVCLCVKRVRGGQMNIL